MFITGAAPEPQSTCVEPKFPNVCYLYGSRTIYLPACQAVSPARYLPVHIVSVEGERSGTILLITNSCKIYRIPPAIRKVNFSNNFHCPVRHHHERHIHIYIYIQGKRKYKLCKGSSRVRERMKFRLLFLSRIDD